MRDWEKSSILVVPAVVAVVGILTVYMGYLNPTPGTTNPEPDYNTALGGVVILGFAWLSYLLGRILLEVSKR